MILYLVNILHVFLPVALITGLILALFENDESPAKTAFGYRHAGLVSLFGILLGWGLYSIAISRQIAMETMTYLGVINILSVFFAIFFISLFSNGKGFIKAVKWDLSVFLVAVINARAIFPFLTFIADQALSVTSVLNTELILNLSGILMGFLILVVLAVLVNRLTLGISRGIAFTLLAIISVILMLKWSGEVILGFMRMETIEMASALLSFVAKVTNLSYLFTYMQIVLLGVLSLLFFIRRHAAEPQVLSRMNNAELRKVRSRVLLEQHWFKSSVVLIITMVSVLLFYDLYASRPPEISTPVQLKPDAEGLIKVKIDDVKDGRLHRFSYITDDGHAVRFFMINLYKEHVKIGVVFDACMMCGGEMGYIQKGNEVICLACGVKIFIWSIGRSGGCNPIPLKHLIEDGYIVVRVKDLEEGADYF